MIAFFKGNISIILILFALLLSASCVKDPNDKSDILKVDLTHIPYRPEPFELQYPEYYPRVQIPADNPMTKAGVELGRFLFYDPILSLDSTISCATCHKQELAFTDGKAISTGIFGRKGKRSSMSLVNIAFVDNGLFWDGRVSTLEKQALHPIEDPLEMGETLDNVIRKLRKSEFYMEEFRRAFGIQHNLEITEVLLAKALAQFQRSIISFNSKFDRFFRNEDFLNDDEFDGYLLFFFERANIGNRDAECAHCHIVGLFSGDFRHNGLISDEESMVNGGRFSVTQNPSDKGKFRSVTLRNIALTAPYMHDGRIASLEDVIQHYASGGHAVRNRDPLIANIQSMNLTPTETRRLMAFLHTLTDSTVITNKAWSNPFQ